MAGMGSLALAASLIGNGGTLAQTMLAQSGSVNQRAARRLRVFVTGSSRGLGYGAARELLAQGHEVVIHVRNDSRLPLVTDLLDKGAILTTGDLYHQDQVLGLAEQVNKIGDMDAVIHNAGMRYGREVLPVNIIAPFLLTALIKRPKRLIYVGSRMHMNGQTDLERQDWFGASADGSYGDSKLYNTTLAMAVARLWPDTISNGLHPGWVPTRMGGANAPEPLRLGHLTQEWLATSDDSEALTSGGYWYRQKRETSHPAVQDTAFQDRLVGKLSNLLGMRLA